MPRNLDSTSEQQVPCTAPAVLNSKVFSAFVQAIEAECASGDAALNASTRRTVFDSASCPRISVRNYLIRVIQWGGFTSEEGLLMAAIYVRRMRECSGLGLTSMNVHRILLAALVIMAKHCSDSHFCNSWYARVGGIALPDLNRLETTFLQCMDWECWVDISEFTEFRESLLKWYASTSGGAQPAACESGAEDSEEGDEAPLSTDLSSPSSKESQKSSNGISDAVSLEVRSASL
eukprot:TRINITY_DN16861_c0_g1_i1.p1 TRINITY_DN16861_c0_g1~~TRINITY_DN16861_c0_g1_i1.p1  ORF type:complete len:234 (+),score=64.56 TRINITY_DN16861_c0_g1_i1:101-802(+)